MIDVEQFIASRFPELNLRRPAFFRTLSVILRHLFHEQEFQQFGRRYPHAAGFDFVDAVLRYFDFTYSVINVEREQIPMHGRLIVVANHPIGSLDGLALLKLVGDVRRDVKVVANDVLSSLKPLHSLLLPVDNLGGRTPRDNLRAIHRHLEQEGAVIIFPAGEVSRLGGKGIRDGVWNPGFLKIAASTRAPILPVFVDGRNSMMFYSLSLLSRPLSTLWLVHEMFKQANRTLPVRIGAAIRHDTWMRVGRDYRERAALFRRHVYRLQKRGKTVFRDLPTVAYPEERAALRAELAASELLGTTPDDKRIYLFHYRPDSAVLREIGRLRELSFRAVGEGSGHRRDLDRFDASYEHIVLWDDAEAEIVGSYRLANCTRLEPGQAGSALYSATLFEFRDGMREVLSGGLELGRSFVQPRYWGKRSLDYLWLGIGAYVKRHPGIRYLFGPVSLSADYDDEAKSALIHLYRYYFGSTARLARAKTEYRLATPDAGQGTFPPYAFSGNGYREDFVRLKEYLASRGLAVPTLYKQYVDVCEAGGVQFADFNLDPDFSNCVDGLIVVDLQKLKPDRRRRYLGD